MKPRVTLPLLLASLLSAPAAGAAGTSLPAAADGLDLVILVDQSASMSGAGGRLRSDRHDLRDLLATSALNLVAASAAPGRARHRLGLVSFGSAPRIDLPLANVVPENLPRLRHAAASMHGRAALGNTNFLAALTAAAGMLDSLPAAPQRRRAIVLITDGVPYVPGRRAGDYGPALGRLCAAALVASKTTLDVFVLSGDDVAWRPYRSLWRNLSHGRLHVLSGDRAESIAGFQEELTRLVGGRAVASHTEAGAGGETLEAVVLPPYLDLVVFDILSGSRDVEVAIFAPDRPNRQLTAEARGVEEIQLGQRMRSVAVRRPVPGIWRFRKADPESRVKVISQQFFLRGTLLAPRGPEPLRQHERVAVIYRVIDSDGAPLEELPGYPLSLALSLTRPDGSSANLAMARRPEAGKAAFAAQEEAACDLPGRYWTEVTIATSDLAAHPVQLFQDHWSGFSVSGATRIDCTVVAPRPGERVADRLWLPWRRPVPTHLRCLDRRTLPVDMAALVKGPPTHLFAASLAAAGAAAPAVLDLAYRGSGVFEGALDGADRPGLYRLRLAVDQARLADGYTVCVVPRETAFYRLPAPLGWVQLLALALSILAAAPILRRQFRRPQASAATRDGDAGDPHLVERRTRHGDRRA